MSRISLILFFSLIFNITAVKSKDKFSEIFQFSSLKNEYKDNPSKIKFEALKIVFFSNINLYTKPQLNSVLNIMPEWSNLPFDKSNFTNEPFFMVLDDQAKNYISSRLVSEPDLTSSIVYEHTQILLQEAIREILYSIKNEPLDMVIFAGNQVYSSEQYPAFQDISQDLTKYKISYYEITGPNELRGTKDLSRTIKDRFFLLKTKATNILVLDNLTASIIPDSLPYEATEQYLWLENTLKSISETEANSDLIIVTYNKLETKVLDMVKFYKLKLVATIDSASDNFNVDKGDLLNINLPSLSSYPCSYGVLKRDRFGNFSFELKMVALEDIQELAKKRMTGDR